jgi:hypothetical protein
MVGSFELKVARFFRALTITSGIHAHLVIDGDGHTHHEGKGTWDESR